MGTTGAPSWAAAESLGPLSRGLVGLSKGTCPEPESPWSSGSGDLETSMPGPFPTDWTPGARGQRLQCLEP